MKKIILEEKVSNIHIDDITTDHIILIKKKGNEFGMAMYYRGYWYGKTIAGTEIEKCGVSDTLKWFGSNCEYYVLG